MTFTAVTYNIQSGKSLGGERDLRAQANVLCRFSPDFAALNEVRAFTGDVPIHQARAMAEMLKMRWAYGPAIEVDGGEYGNAFLSKHPILESAVIHIPDAVDSETPDSFEHRAILRNVVEIEGTRIVVLVSHYGLSPGERRSAVRATVDLIGRERMPVIFMGDLNASPDDPVLDPLYEVLSDVAQREAFPMTWPSGEPSMRIDYIFTSREFAALSPISPETHASDHRPVAARLQLL